MESTNKLCSDKPGKARLLSLLRLFAIVPAVLLSAYPSQAAPAISQPKTNSAEKLPTLTTARQAHSLSTAEALRAYPVHIRGIVTYFDQNYGTGYAAIFIHDSTGSVFLRPLSSSVGWLAAGTVIDVRGVSCPGGFGPIVAKPQIRVIGRSPLPANPPRVSLPKLETGAEDAQWVEVEGTIHGISEYTHSVTLQLAMIDGTVSVTMPRETAATYSNLVDAKVIIHANAAPTVNSDAQMLGVHLMAPDLSVVTVVEPAPGDPFRRPLTAINKLLHWDEFSASFHRVHLRGNVTLQWPGSSLCIRDATGGICAQTAQDTPLAAGDLVDIAGFAGTEDNKPVLTDAVFKLAGKGGLVPAKPISVEEALRGNHDSDLVQMDGLLIAEDQATSSMNLILTSGNTIFAAVLPKGMKGTDASLWKTGSKLRVTGICSVQIDARSHVREGVTVTRSFRIMLRTPQDVVVLKGPSWWTAGHILVLLALALAATLCVLGWVMVLRRHVQKQANLLRESESRFRHMALHDALTGLATRLLLEDRLSTAVEAAKRHHTGLTVFIIDLDQFKGINDTYGHHCGDEVLRISADRLTQAVRKSDTVARLGGDEFVVLLPDMSDPRKAEGIAAKIVKSLACPILFAGREVPVSASVGICNSTGRELDAEALLKCADEALYQAKANGRNCFHVSGRQQTPAGSVA
jgi:diguanylate cyclase (GGDEF)-like protein